MTLRLFGLPEEIRLAIEQAEPGTRTEPLRLVYEAAVTEAIAQTTTAVNQSLRELQSIIGPHGSITRLQTGGIRIANGEGIGVYLDGVFKTNIQPNGTLVIGSNIEDPTTTTEIFFVEDTAYNGEEFAAGDFLIGDNSASTSNVKYDASEGQLQFRSGQTVQAYMGTDGKIYAGAGDIFLDADGAWIANQSGAFGFLDTNGDKFKLYILSDGDDHLVLKNKVGGKGIRLETDTAAASPLLMTWVEDDSVANASKLVLATGSAGGNIHLGAGVQIWASKDGTGTVFNEDSFDVDFRVEGATNPGVFVVNAGEDRVELQNGTTAVHILNPTGKSYFNEPNNDIDTVFEGTTDANLLLIDAGLDAIGMGGAAESGYKAKITGALNVAGAVKKNGNDLGQLFGSSGLRNTIAASTTGQLFPFYSGAPVSGNWLCPIAGTLSNLYIGIASAQPASGSLVCTLMVAGSATSVVVTIAAGSAQGTYSDTVNTAAVAAGDTVRWNITNNATAASAQIGALSTFFVPD